MENSEKVNLNAEDLRTVSNGHAEDHKMNPEDPEVKKSKLEAGIFPVSIAGSSEWHYRGEGGANLVISLLKEKKVLRFSKSKYPDKDHDSKILEIAFYANNVMRHALGEHFMRQLAIGVVSDTDFEHVRQEAQQFRPVERCKKDIMSHRVIVSPDCVFLTQRFDLNTVGETFSIEIKPKQGWHSEKATCAVDLCSRCLKQYAKLYQGKIDRISRYCPLDLFSGDRQRMKRAVFDLFENPHNRFKIYKDGDLIYTENKGDPLVVEKDLRKWLLGNDQEKDSSNTARGLHHLASLLCVVLLTNFEPTSKDKHSIVTDDWIDLQLEDPLVPVRCRRLSCDTRCERLPQGCILQKVLSLQKHADISDHDAKVLCEKLLNNIDDLERLQQLILWHPMTVEEQSRKSTKELEVKGLSRPEIENLQQLQRFLLSVTAKDVSLLITFRQVEDPSIEPMLDLPSVQIPKSGKYFRVMISVIDLDPKPVHRISTWVKRKEEYLQIYRLNTQPENNPPQTKAFKCDKLLTA